MAAGDYGAHEYEVTVSVRVYADTPDAAYSAGTQKIRHGGVEGLFYAVRLIDEDEEES